MFISFPAADHWITLHHNTLHKLPEKVLFYIYWFLYFSVTWQNVVEEQAAMKDKVPETDQRQVHEFMYGEIQRVGDLQRQEVEQQI